MTRDQILNLQHLDEVYWTDPDDDRCSGTYKILFASIWADPMSDDDPIVKITDVSGRYLECYASELS